MKRGSYGKPWRPPADGWSVPPLYYLGGPYQHQRSTLNGRTHYQNTTQCQLQQDQYGPPVTRYTINLAPGSCEQHPINGLPNGPWLGVGDNQFTTPPPNTFVANGTVDFGASCRQRGGKWVQAVRNWHGTFGWLSHDGTNVCPDIVCQTEVPDVFGNNPGDTGYTPTYNVASDYESYQPNPSQTKYLTVAVDLTYESHFNDDAADLAGIGHRKSTASGSRSVNPLTGQISNNITTTDYQNLPIVTFNIIGNPGAGISWTQYDVLSITNGFGWRADLPSDTLATSALPATLPHIPLRFASSLIDLVAGTDPHCGTITIPVDGRSLDNYVAAWNQGAAIIAEEEGDYSFWPPIPPVTDPNNYSAATGDFIDETGYTTNLAISWSKSDILFKFSYKLTSTRVFGAVTVNNSTEFYGSMTLTDPNPSAAVYTDIQGLLGCWNLADDAQYPPRTDGIWQVAPLMSRDEAPGNLSPLGFNQYYVNDLRAPITDQNGNAPFTTGTNPPAPGWAYSPNNNDSAGNPPDSDSYGGAADWQSTYDEMPWFDPSAYGFTFPFGMGSANSSAIGWGQYALTGNVLGAPNPAGCQDYFDFRANVWKYCSAGGPDWYLQGYGQWLSEVIHQTGAQLPLNATQWTNNFAAAGKPPYAYLIQADHNLYSGVPAHRADALWAQKCMEYLELWPSYDFFRPAGADRFAFDQSTMVCFESQSGSMVTLTDNEGAPANLTIGPGDVWGGTSVNGYYHVTGGGNTITLGDRVLALPYGIVQEGFGKLRFPGAPAILGRDAVTTVTDNGDGTCTLTLAAPEPWLLTGDAIDLYRSTVTYDSHGNRVSETMTPLAARLSATVASPTRILVTAGYAAISGTQYIMSYGAPDWCWDDTGRKGDFAGLTWTYDYRTTGEAGRLAGQTDCDGSTPPSDAPPMPANTFSNFTQTAYTLPFKPCCPATVFITPNGESSPNSVTISFPAGFNFDDRYGTRWQGEIEQAMADLLYEAPHIPCDWTLHWSQDDGTCQDDTDDTQFYGYAPLVEARISVPTNGGNNANLTAPTPPTGIGYISPVDNASGLGPPGMIGFDPDTGNPSPAWTAWGYRQNIEAQCAGCRFDYAGLENLACDSSPSGGTPLIGTPPPDRNTGDGDTGSGVT